MRGHRPVQAQIEPVVSTTEPPKPTELPLPPPVAVLPPQPKVETEVVTSAPTVDNDDDGPRPPEALAAARKALEAGDHEKALKYAKVAILRLPKRSGAWNTLGRIQLRMGKRKDAITSFEQAVELNPSNSYARNNLGLALIYDKRYDEAIDALEEAVTLEPVEGYMWNNLGMAYEHLDRLDDAREAYGKAIELQNERAGTSLARLKGVESVVTHREGRHRDRQPVAPAARHIEVNARPARWFRAGRFFVLRGDYGY